MAACQDVIDDGSSMPSVVVPQASARRADAVTELKSGVNPSRVSDQIVGQSNTW